MKNSLFTKFENVFNDLRSYLASQIAYKPMTMIEEPKQIKKNNTQQTISKRKRSTKSENLIKPKNKSMSDSQGIPKFSGSGYNGQGNPDHGKIRSNKKRR